jgi:hypothetical protein
VFLLCFQLCYVRQAVFIAHVCAEEVFLADMKEGIIHIRMTCITLIFLSVSRLLQTSDEL